MTGALPRGGLRGLAFLAVALGAATVAACKSSPSDSGPGLGWHYLVRS